MRIAHRLDWIAFVALVAFASIARAAASDDLDRARALQRDGRYREAVALYRQVADASLSTDPRVAGIALNNACVCLVELSEAEPALPLCREALRLRRALGDPRSIARSLNNTGRALERLGHYDEANDHLREALSINRERGDTLGVIFNHINLGVIATLVGDYGGALDSYRSVATLAASDDAGAAAAPYRRVAILNEGVVLERLGAYDEAMIAYRKLIDEGVELPPAHQLSLQTNLATLYRNLGDPVRAAQSIRKASEIAETLGDAAGVANARLNLGIVQHRNLGQPAAAKTSYRDALERSLELGNADLEIETRLNLGDLAIAGSQLEEAHRQYERARQRAEETGARDTLARALGGLGRVAARNGEEHKAVTHLEQAIDLVEGIRAGIEQQELRGELFAARRAVFGNAVAALARLDSETPDGGYAERAFEIAQRAKQRELLEAVGRNVGGTAPQSVESIRDHLGDAMLVEFFAGTETLFRWTLSRDGELAFDALGPVATIEADVRELHDALSSGSAAPVMAIEKLAAALLPSDPAIRASKLFIAPDRLLHYLPFELLVPRGASAPLIERAVVVYLPSASILARTKAHLSLDAPLVAFGAASSAPAQRSTAGDTREILLSRFALAPIDAAELETVGARLGRSGPVFRGEAATESALRRAAPEAGVLHLATHTVVDDRMRAGAAVLLAPEGDDDGLLFAREIAGLDLRNHLTTLAACSTALGAESEGRGLSSLTGAFLAAGSRSVVATLWDVDDAATAVFMEQMYFQLSRGLTPAEALRQTKLRMRQNASWQRPDLWAAFIVVGDAGPVAKERWWASVPWQAILALLLVAGAWGVWQRRASRAATG